MERMELLPNVYLSTVQTDKFKTALLSVSLLTQLDRQNAAANAVLPSLLRRGSSRYSDMTALQNRLDGLYGASLEPLVRRFGELQSIGFCAEFCDERFLPEKLDMTGEMAALLGEVLLHPNTRGGLFRQAWVESEKEKLAERIDARVNDKRSYATTRLNEEMCCYEDYGTYILGSRDSAENLQYVSLSKHYKELLATSPIELFYCGSAEAQQVADALYSAFLTLPRGEIDEEMGTDIRMNSVSGDIRFFEEEMDVSQGQLALGFRLGECMEEPDYAAIRVFNALYGGSAASRLFKNVREKLSLCYYAGSGVDLHKGLLRVLSGVDFSKRQQAQDEILAQLESLKSGVAPQELEEAKRSLISGYRSVSDSPAALESYWTDQLLLGEDYDPDTCAALVESVSAADVLAVANSVVCDAIYFLKGESHE